MKTLIVVAKTIEDAISDGLSQLGLTRDEVDVEVLEQPSKGLFGFGGKEAKISITVIEKKRESNTFAERRSL
jgi:spoIIIJ-associated protein